MKTSKNTKVAFGLLAALGVTWVVGCSGGKSNPAAGIAPSEAGAKYILSAEPSEAKGVIEIRENAQDNEDVVVVGRIGGTKEPWVPGEAAFEIVDVSKLACTDAPAMECSTPWDYCRVPQIELAQARVLVQIVDAAGKPVSQDAKELLGVKELQTVVLQGKAKRDKDGLTILASKLYVQK